MSGIMMATMMVSRTSSIVNPLSGGTFRTAAISPNTATCTLIFDTNGEVLATTFGGFLVFVHNWYTPTTTNIGNSYWIRATLSSGTTPTGTLNTWQQLSSFREWSLTRSAPGFVVSVLSIQIASDSSGTNVVTSGSYEIRATVEI